MERLAMWDADLGRFLPPSLAANCTLAAIDLSHNELTAAGARAICAALDGNGGLRALRLNNNHVGNEGAEAFLRLLGGGGGGGGGGGVEGEDGSGGSGGVGAAGAQEWQRAGGHRALVVLELTYNDIDSGAGAVVLRQIQQCLLQNKKQDLSSGLIST
jgi:hypothetical protein